MGLLRNRPVTLGTSFGSPVSAGARASHAWFVDRGLHAPTQKRWHVEIAMSNLDTPTPAQFDERVDTRFHVDIYAEEWGFFFCHGGRMSWIRVTDIPFVHGRDDFGLLAHVPTLSDISTTLRTLEQQHQLQFHRRHALIRTNVAGAEPSIRRWIEAL